MAEPVDNDVKSVLHAEPAIPGNPAVAQPYDVIDRVAFRKWLETDPKRIFPHEADWRCQCPIARYARERMSLPAAEMGVTWFYPGGDSNHSRAAPRWATAFVRLFDGLSHTDPTAAAALTVLDRIEP